MGVVKEKSQKSKPTLQDLRQPKERVEKMEEADDEIEKEAFSRGYRLVAGVDEAGRGPLAGPVVASACILPFGCLIEGVKDSKKLTPQRREKVYLSLTSHPDVKWAIGIVEHQEIDDLNILNAALKAMSLAVEDLTPCPDFLLVDGNQKFPAKMPSQTVIGGDALSKSIAAASIIAKYSRDQIMMEHHLKWPQYGFIRHKGYATREHVRAIREYGISPIHRRSFEPIKSLFC